MNANTLPQLAGRPMVTDGGMETDLIFHHGVDLPLFAAFPLVDTPAGRSLLTAYYEEYAAIARRAGAGLMLESATWRASSDWGDRLGYSPADLARVNRDAISMLAELRERYRDDLADVVISGMVGPRGDGYQPGRVTTPPPGATPSWTRRPTWTRATSACWPTGTSGSPPACRRWPSWAGAAGRTPVTSRPSGISRPGMSHLP